MFPGNFEYVRADSLKEALTLLSGEDCKALAGGHSLIPLLKQRLAQPAKLVDISGLEELKGIAVEGGKARIGALTTHRQLAASDTLAQSAQLLPEAAALVGDPQVRNRGTIGGNIAHADPASDLPAVLLALNAEILIVGPDGQRTVKADGFFSGLMDTDLGENEVISQISFTSLGSGDGSAYRKFEHPASGYAICGAASVIRDGQVRLAFNGVAPVPFVASSVSEALSGSDLSDAAIDSALAALEHEDPLSDLHASAEYRLHLAKVYGGRCLRAARDRRG